jgi:SdrD B-like domain
MALAQSTPGLTSSLTGVVFVDANRNGRRDPDELGIPNTDVTVTDSVTGASVTVMTDESGRFTANVVPGTYSVTTYVIMSGVIQPTRVDGNVVVPAGIAELDLPAPPNTDPTMLALSGAESRSLSSYAAWLLAMGVFCIAAARFRRRDFHPIK